MISLEKNFLFIHIFKTGGNSLQNILHKYAIDEIHKANDGHDGVERFMLKNDRYKVKKHSRLIEYQSVLEPEVYRKLYKFTTIRNPWDRMISLYFSPHRGVTKWVRDEFITLVKQDFTLRDFIGLPEEKSWKSSLKLKSAQTPVDGSIDFVIKFEQLNEGFQTLCNKLDIPYEPLPHRNKSSREHYSRYYDDELIELVADKHREEIALGNYRFS